MDGFVIRVLGPIEVWADGVVRPLQGRRQRALLALLAVHAGHLVSRERLLDELWEGRPPATAAKSLQNAVVYLRRQLERDPRSPTVLVTEQGGYRLLVDDDRLDAIGFEQLVGSGRALLADRRAAEAASILEEGLSLWRGQAYGDVADLDGVASEVGRLEELRLFAREELLEANLQLGRHAEIVAELRSLITEEPLRERPRRLLMVALYRCGRQEEALEVYRTARADLLDRLAIDTSPEFQALQQAVLNQDPALLGPARPPVVPRLPAPPTELLGRQEELAQLADLLAPQEVRLLTLTGPGGIGKTRLALALARRVADAFPDGVYFIDLSPLDDPRFALDEVARAVGVRAAATETLLDRVKETLQGKRLLLVLDNFEHLLEARRLVSELLRGAAELVFVVTSRTRLRLYGEHEYRVPPLPVPPRGGRLRTDELACFDAVALFVARSRASNSSFTLSDDNAVAVAELCTRLDGIPLALELVAARSDTFTPAGLLERIERRLSFLTDGPIDLPERQQTMRAALDWSHERLTEHEQELFACAALFAGSFAAEAAVAVCQTDVRYVDALVDKSLLTRASVDGGSRLRMFDTIREYASERLDGHPRRGELVGAYVDYYASLAQDAEPHLRRQVQADLLNRLETERDNLRAAHALALTVDPVRALAMAAALWRFWYVRGYVNEGRTCLTDALQRAEHAAPADVRAAALGGAGGLASQQGDLDAARDLLQASVEAYESIDDQHGAAAVTGDLAVVAASGGDYERAGELFERARARFTELGDREYAALAEGNLGVLTLHAGDPTAAIRPLRSARAELTAIGATDRAVAVGHSLGLAHLALAETTAARAVLGETVQEAAAIEARLTVLLCLQALAALFNSEGNRETAARLAAFVDHRCHELEFEPPAMEEALCGPPLQHARSDATDPTFSDDADAGRRMTFEQAVTTARLALQSATQR